MPWRPSACSATNAPRPNSRRSLQGTSSEGMRECRDDWRRAVHRWLRKPQVHGYFLRLRVRNSLRLPELSLFSSATCLFLNGKEILAFSGAAASVAAPSALQPSPRRSAAAAPGPVTTFPPLPQRRIGLAPVAESCLQLDARRAPVLEDVSQPLKVWKTKNDLLKPHVRRGMPGPPESMSGDVGDPGLFRCICKVGVVPGGGNAVAHCVEARTRLRESLGVAARTFPGRMQS